MSKKNVRKVAFGLLLIPAGFISLFLFGELFGGDIGGISHLLQLAPLLLMMWAAWKWPNVGGTFFMIIGIFFGGLYLMSDLLWATKIIVELILFVPMIVAGYLLRTKLG